jgi:aldose sugar dehydrogenase
MELRLFRPSAFFSLLLTLSLVACGGGSDSNGNNGGTGGGGGDDDGGGGGREPVEVVTETVASGLTVPWAMAFAPDGRMFFTEQPGRLRVISADGTLEPTPVFATATGGGEAGMLGLDIDPNFANNHFLYMFYCTGSNPNFNCHLVRLVENNNTATIDTVLLEVAGGLHHNAGRIKVGPDNKLYVAIGDLGVPENSQNLTNDAGKILRLELDGSPASGNPIPENPRVWAYGLRDPQGLAFDSSGQLYATDHGQNSNDEVNIIRAGANYGWPDCEGTCNAAGIEPPIKLFNPETAAPSGATFYNSDEIPQWTGSMFFATLGLSDNTFAHHLHRMELAGPGSDEVTDEEILYRDEFGRIRDVIEGPDGFLYFSTSNGGGTDRVVRIRPQQ